MLILMLREMVLWPLLDWSGAVIDAVMLGLRAPDAPSPSPQD